jgi:hypothetical protein
METAEDAFGIVRIVPYEYVARKARAATHRKAQ